MLLVLLHGLPLRPFSCLLPPCLGTLACCRFRENFVACRFGGTTGGTQGPGFSLSKPRPTNHVPGETLPASLSYDGETGVDQHHALPRNMGRDVHHEGLFKVLNAQLPQCKVGCLDRLQICTCHSCKGIHRFNLVQPGSTSSNVLGRRLFFTVPHLPGPPPPRLKACTRRTNSQGSGPGKLFSWQMHPTCGS